jgi:hypothetical protein
MRVLILMVCTLLLILVAHPRMEPRPRPHDRDAESAGREDQVTSSGGNRLRNEILELRRVADYGSAGGEARSKAVFSLFAKYLQPPRGKAAVRQVLGDAPWVRSAAIRAITSIAGWIPVSPMDSVFDLTLFGGFNRWGIYLRMTGMNGETESAQAFLQGRVGLQVAPQLVEFALCYPDGRIERYYEGGMCAFDLGWKRTEGFRSASVGF